MWCSWKLDGCTCSTPAPCSGPTLKKLFWLEEGGGLINGHSMSCSSYNDERKNVIFFTNRVDICRGKRLRVHLLSKCTKFNLFYRSSFYPPLFFFSFILQDWNITLENCSNIIKWLIQVKTMWLIQVKAMWLIQVKKKISENNLV